jgi:hypothetical protein
VYINTNTDDIFLPKFLKLVYFESFNSLKNLAHFDMVLHFLFSSLSSACHSVPAEAYLDPLLIREEETSQL